MAFLYDIVAVYDELYRSWAREGRGRGRGGLTLYIFYDQITEETNIMAVILAIHTKTASKLSFIDIIHRFRCIFVYHHYRNTIRRL